MGQTLESVTIRNARHEDVPAIAAMAEEFHAFLAKIDGSDATFDRDGAVKRLDRSGFGERPFYSGLIAECDGETVGYAIYNFGFWADTFESMIFLSDLFVREGWRGRGVGRQIMAKLAESGRREDCTRLMWTVWSKNEAAQRFYRNLGGTAIGDEVLMMQSIA